jgi:hypothetical protein
MPYSRFDAAKPFGEPLRRRENPAAKPALPTADRPYSLEIGFGLTRPGYAIENRH